MDALAWAALRHGVQIEAAHRVTGIRVDHARRDDFDRRRHLVVRGRRGDCGGQLVAAGSMSTTARRRP